MPESAATKNTPPSTTSADEQGEVTKPTFQHAPISPSTATTNSNPVPNAESSTSPSPPSKKDFDNKKRTIKIPSVFIAIFAIPLHFFHPTKSPIILSHPIFLINPYIFISLGFIIYLFISYPLFFNYIQIRKFSAHIVLSVNGRRIWGRYCSDIYLFAYQNKCIKLYNSKNVF